MQASSTGFRRVSRREPCPICGKSDWCRVFGDGGVECMRRESPQPCISGGWMHYGPPGATIALNHRPKPQDHLRAPIPSLDLAYRALLTACPLSDDHRSLLDQRQIDPSFLYGTLHADSAWRIGVARNMLGDLGWGRLCGVPGCYLLDRGTWSIAGPAGILIPILDAQQRIVGMQIRRDADDGSRYSFLSSRELRGGTGSGAPTHVRRRQSTSPVIITEGPLKADYHASRTGTCMLAVPGVSATSGVLPALKAIANSDAGTEVIIAYDMDWKHNPQVRRSRRDLMSLVWRAGYAVAALSWDAMTAKGLDDAGRLGLDIVIHRYFPGETIPQSSLYTP